MQPKRPLPRNATLAGYLSAAALFALLTSADTFAQDQSKPKILEIESMGARAFGGTAVPMPDDPTNFQACDHGFASGLSRPKRANIPWYLSTALAAGPTRLRSTANPDFGKSPLRGKIPCLLGRLAVDWASRQGLLRIHVESR